MDGSKPRVERRLSSATYAARQRCASGCSGSTGLISTLAARSAFIVASHVLNFAYHPCRRRCARKLGAWEAPSFASVWCQSFRDGLSTKGMQMNRRGSHLIAGWRTGLPRPVLILQAGSGLNWFGYGLVLPFEIIYLHQIRGFSTPTAGVVLAAIMGRATIATPPIGALLDRYSAKAMV